MKVWQGYGAEHSMNLVIVGSFKDAHDAEQFAALTHTITEFLQSPDSNFDYDSDRFSKEVLDFLGQHNLYNFSPQQLAQFLYDLRVEQKGSKIVISSDDDLNVLMSLLIHKGARVESFSGHDYPELADKEL
jgi:hypothetical protein